MIRTSLKNPLLWLVFAIYVFLLGYTMFQHELWGDEIHAWNLAKGSHSFSDLLYNIRYEGHPPAWHFTLWLVSKFTHQVSFMQLPQFIIAVAIAFAVLFLSPLPLVSRMLIPFGYYFLYEYGALSRNYALAVLFAAGICIIMRRRFAYKLPVYYGLLFGLCCSHLLAIPLAAGLHLYFLLANAEAGKKIKEILPHAVLGILAALPALYFIFPPSDSSINFHFWSNNWKPDQFALFSKAPAWSFMPVPAWWKYYFWNSHFLLDSDSRLVVKVITPFISLLLLAGVYVVLRKSKKSLALFGASFLSTAFIALTFFGLSSARYVGFVYISFIIAWWMYCYEEATTATNKILINALLVVQLMGGVFAAVKDILFPFSVSYKVEELLKEVPAGEVTVTDYWGLDIVSAFADKPMYCLDWGKEVSFMTLRTDSTVLKRDSTRYFKGIRRFFDQRKETKKMYMLTAAWPQNFARPDIRQSYNIKLIDKRIHSIDHTGLYLYEVENK